MNSKKAHKVRKGVELGADNLKWFYSEFGDDASISWYLNLLFTKARELHEVNIYSPQSVVEMAAKEIKEIEHEIG